MAVLVHRNSRPGRSIQELPEVEGRKLIPRVLANVACERGNRTRIARFQLGERVHITFCGGAIVLIFAKRLESTHCLYPASQHKVTDRPTTEILHRFCESRAYTNAGAESLVGGFEPRRNVDGIAVGSVVKESTSPEIADYCRSRMDPKTRYAQCDALFLAAFAKRLGKFVE